MLAAADLVAAVRLRFGDARLNVALIDKSTLPARLLERAQGLIDRVHSAVQSSVGWPLPGVWPVDAPNPLNSATTVTAGTPFADVWPGDLVEHALGLIYWRMLDGYASISTDVRRVGQAHEAYFKSLEDGSTALGVGGKTDVGPPSVLTARDRSGRSLMSDGSADRNPIYHGLQGVGWDF
jgi:hypothetical protein